MNRVLLRWLLLPLRSRCAWHRGDTPCENDMPGCQDCGSLLDIKECRGCGHWFLDFGSVSFDDVVAAPTVTNSGDLVCIRCVGHYEDEFSDEFEDELEQFQ